MQACIIQRFDRVEDPNEFYRGSGLGMVRKEAVRLHQRQSYSQYQDTLCFLTCPGPIVDRFSGVL